MNVSMKYKGWEVVQCGAGDVNILPINDTHPHTEEADCACKPTATIEGARLMIVHNAWDKREILEQAIQVIMEDAA